MKKQKAQDRKPSKLHLIAESTAHDFAHQNSYTITSRIRVLQCYLDETDKSIVAMVGALTNLREKRAKIEAQIRGLTSVVAKR